MIMDFIKLLNFNIVVLWSIIKFKVKVNKLDNIIHIKVFIKMDKKYKEF